jgi:hypothetical protein
MKKKDGINPAAFGALMNGDLENFMVASTPGGIEAQEAQGQADLVRSETLPIECDDGRSTFEAMGIVFGDPVDDLFVAVKLPAGWMKRPTDHFMWSDLLDEHGRARACIFYKAAFYDRSAHMFARRRFTIKSVFDGVPNGSRAVACYDVGEEICRAEVEQDPEKPWLAGDAARAQCKEWLDERYPDWNNPLAYWVP